MQHKKYSELTDNDYKHENDTISGDTVYFKTAEIADEHQAFNKLNVQQEIFIKDCLTSADSLIRSYIHGVNINNYTPKTLDKLIDEWNVDSTKFQCEKEHFVNIVGFAFGQYLVKEYHMYWTIVTDEEGKEYATKIDGVDFLNFPLNSVLKAIDQHREGSLNTISLLTKRDIEKLRNSK